MLHYGKVYRQVWTDEKFRALPPDGRTLWLYLLTCPHGNSFGYFVLDDAYAAADLQWSRRKLAAAWRSIPDTMAVRDRATRVVFLPKAGKYDAPANPDVCKAWTRILASMPYCESLFMQFCDTMQSTLQQTWAQEWIHGLRHRVNTVGDTVSTPCTTSRNPEPRAQSPEPRALISLSPPSGDDGDGQTIFRLYDENIARLTPIIRDELVAAEKEYGPERVTGAIRLAGIHNVRKWTYIEAILRNGEDAAEQVNVLIGWDDETLLTNLTHRMTDTNRALALAEAERRGLKDLTTETIGNP